MNNATITRIGEHIPPVTVMVSRGLIDKFSEFANDRNPVHLNDEFARQRGFPGAIAHGAIAASFLLRMLTTWLGEWPRKGDDLDITSISPVLVGTAVTATGFVESVEDDWLVCQVWCEAQDGKKLLVGKARVAPRPK